jgi:hypothetical protein
MRRYVTVAGDWSDDANGADHLARTVYEPEDRPLDTGLLDRHGNKIFAVSSREPVGFVRFSSSL